MIRRTLHFVRTGHPVLAVNWLLTDVWLWLTERIAVEWRRAFPVARHSETRADTRRRDDAWAVQLHDIAAELEPLPVQVGNYRDPLRQYIDAAWQATGMTPAEYWASVAPPSDLPGPDAPVATAPACRPADLRAGEPRTPNQAMNLWQPNDVIPPRIAATLARAQADQTVIDSDLTPETRAQLVEEFAGGDVYDGQGEAWFDAFDRIEARAHEAIAKARAELEQLFLVAAR